MFYRDLPDMSAGDLLEAIEPDKGEEVQVRPEDLEVRFDSDIRNIRFKKDGGQTVEVPVYEPGVKAIGGWLDVPYKFLDRSPRDLQQTIVTRLFEQNPEPFILHFDEDTGVTQVRSPETTIISPKRYVEVAIEVMGEDAQVVSWTCDPDVVQFDLIVPEGRDFGWGGDRKTKVENREGKKVGDITGGGLRFGQDRKRNLAPWVQQFLFRLACTNGMETRDDSYKVDARGASAIELLHQLEESARLAFNTVEDTITSFYDLRNEEVKHPTQAVMRLADEQGLPNRTRMDLADLVPGVIGNDGNATMFDVVNLVTNAANSTGMRLNEQRRLQAAGGAEVVQHAARCKACAAKLN